MTSRSTPTSRCRSTGRRHVCPTATPPACTAGRCRSRSGGSIARSCCTSAVPRACTPLYVNGEFVGYGTDSRLASEYDITAVRARRSERRRHRGHAMERAQLRRGPGPVVDGRACTARCTSRREAAVHLGVAGVRRGAPRCGHVRRVGTLAARATLVGLAPPGPGLAGPLRRRDPARSTTRSPARPSLCRTGSRRPTSSAATPPSASFELPGRRSVVGGVADAVPGDRRTDRSDGAVAEVHAQLVGFRSRRGPRPPTPRERRADLGLRGEPPRPPSDPRQGGDGRRHARRPARDATAQHHRRALLALSRTIRGFLDLCDEIGMYVVDEANIESHAYNTSLCDDAAVPLDVVVAGCSHGRTRPQPSERDHVVARQRGRLRRQPRRAGRLDPSHRPVAAAALRGRGVPRRLGRRWHSGERRGVPDVSDDRLDRRVRPRGAGRSTVDHVRVQPCDGQLERFARRLLGRDHLRRPVCRAGSSGSGRTTGCSPGCPSGKRGLRLRGSVRRRTERRQLRGRRSDVVRPAAASRGCRR